MGFLNSGAVSHSLIGGRGPSGTLWGKSFIDRIRNDPNAGWGFMDDFNAVDSIVSSNAGRVFSEVAYRTREDNNTSVLQVAAAKGGILRLLVTDDNAEVNIQAGGATGSPFLISSTVADISRLWFEARIRLSSVTDGDLALFIGLAEEGLAAAATIGDTGAVAEKDYIGFKINEDDGNSIDTVLNIASGVGPTTLEADVGVPVAATFIKLGFRYDWNDPDERIIRFFVDGVETATAITKTTAGLMATTVPDGEGLQFLFAIGAGTDTTLNNDLDWVACYQEGSA